MMFLLLDAFMLCFKGIEGCFAYGFGKTHAQKFEYFDGCSIAIVMVVGFPC